MASRILNWAVVWEPSAPAVIKMYSLPFILARLARHNPASSVYPVLPPRILPREASDESRLVNSVLENVNPSGWSSDGCV